MVRKVSILKGFCFSAFFFLASCATVSGPLDFERQKDIFYTEERIERQSADLFLPKVKGEAKKWPVVIVVHGGGWTGGSKRTMAMVSKSLAAHGFAVFNINYLLAPEFLHPSPYDDMKRAYRFLHANAEKYSLDMSRVGLWGYSAGGHIVSYFALKVLQDKERDQFPVSAVVAGGTPFDITWYSGSSYTKSYIGMDRDEAPEKYIEASPVSHVSENAPPFFLYHAVQDRLVVHPQAMAFEFRMKQVGAEVERYNVGYWGHTMTVVMSESANKAGVDFLRRKMMPEEKSKEVAVRQSEVHF